MAMKTCSINQILKLHKQSTMKPIVEIAEKIGLSEDDLELYGKYKAKIII